MQTFNIGVEIEQNENYIWIEKEIEAENEQEAILDFVVNELGIYVEEVKEAKGKKYLWKEIQAFRSEHNGKFNFTVLGTNKERFKEEDEL